MQERQDVNRESIFDGEGVTEEFDRKELRYKGLYKLEVLVPCWLEIGLIIGIKTLLTTFVEELVG